MSVQAIIFNKHGNPSLILHQNGHLISFSGKSVGFLDGDSVFDYNGRHRGWFEKGILRDHDGFCVGFLQGSRDISPLLPITKISSIPAIPEIEPIRPIKEIKPIKPIKQLNWSIFDPLSLFKL
jgi:hypothetical protein